MPSDDFGALHQPRSEHRMCKIGLCLCKIADRIRPRHSAAPEPGDLREDEPHPVTGLTSIAKLCDCALVRAAPDLCSDEALEIHAPDVSARRRAH